MGPWLGSSEHMKQEPHCSVCFGLVADKGKSNAISTVGKPLLLKHPLRGVEKQKGIGLFSGFARVQYGLSSSTPRYSLPGQFSQHRNPVSVLPFLKFNRHSRFSQTGCTFRVETGYMYIRRCEEYDYYYGATTLINLCAMAGQEIYS